MKCDNCQKEATNSSTPCSRCGSLKFSEEKSKENAGWKVGFTAIVIVLIGGAVLLSFAIGAFINLLKTF